MPETVIGRTKLFVLLVLIFQLILQASSLPTRFVPASSIEDVFPKAPADYPDALKGIIWMDQSGVFGHSDVPFSAPDLGICFGDTAFHTLDRVERKLKVDVAGPCWQWMNKPLGYMAAVMLKTFGFHYEFEWNEDYTSTQIYPSLDLGSLGTIRMPSSILSFTMVKQPEPPSGVCPPSPGASKKDITRCANWDRVSSGFFSPLFGSYGVIHYYVYQIVDKDGKRIQPYYDAYLAWAANNTNPSESLARFVGIELPKEGAEKLDSFVGVRTDTSSQRADDKAAEL